MKIGKRLKNQSYIIRDEKGNPIKDENGKDLVIWRSRSTAISTVVLGKKDNKYYILANKRGPKTPDYQGCWNMVCGYLEGFESAQEGCTREVYEETGILIRPELFKLINVETNPLMCSHGNVTLRFICFLQYLPEPQSFNKSRGGEDEEVSEVKWIDLDKIDDYKWAFNHKETIVYYKSYLSYIHSRYLDNNLSVTYD